jgi:FkbH-like protein
MLHGEKIRLVIWDLDETFWRGTLSEGGIHDYVRAHHDIVIELANRGIISSICSKNDVAPVEAILREQGLWDYFVFPSIDWTPKGPRLRQLIEDVQLRPETVLFIDDNASNRAEAARFVPGLQIADEHVIARLLDDPALRGKADPELTRLKQYQMLQRRKADEKSVGADNRSFLRASHITVLVDPDIEANLDRAIELVNRTNQLNFTKLRLSDDRAEAERELLRTTQRYCNQAGLIRVWDDYGDHGICGFYVVETGHHRKMLLHFCFSCRILGIGVEQWLYEKLGRPDITISGEVSSQLTDSSDIDWINQDIDGALVFAEGYTGAASPSFAGVSSALAPEIRLRGGCELDAIGHYLRQETPKLVSLNGSIECAFHVHRDETTNLGLFTAGMSEAVRAEVDAFELFGKDYDQSLFEGAAPGTPFVLTTWGDINLPVYRHTTLGFEIGVTLWGGLRRRPDLAGTDIPDAMESVWNLGTATESDLDRFLDQYVLRPDQQTQVRRIARLLRENYVFTGPVSFAALARNVETVLARIPRDCPAAIMLPNFRPGEDPFRLQMLHANIREVVRRFPNCFTVDPANVIADADGQEGNVDHLDRMEYYRIYQELIAQFSERLAQLPQAQSEAAE